MWLMTTKNRPIAAERAATVCWSTGMKQPAYMFVDGDPRGYNEIKLPDNWTLVIGRDVNVRPNLAGSKQWAFRTFPDERVYGWMADDNIPETPYWSYVVEDLAHPWYLVHCKDNFISAMDTVNADRLYRTHNLGGGICWGGDLMRSVGFWSPPGVVQGCIDWFWTSLVGDTPLGLYLHNVTVKHHNWRTGEREMDDNDKTIIKGQEAPWIKEDKMIVGDLIKSDTFKELKERVLNEYIEYTRAT